MFAGSLIIQCLFSRPHNTSLKPAGTLLTEDPLPRSDSALSIAAHIHSFALYSNSQGKQGAFAKLGSSVKG